MMFSAVIDRVRSALESIEPDIPLEEVVSLCPELTWNQVFLAIDFLSRVGEIQMILDPGRTYRVRPLIKSVSIRVPLPETLRSADDTDPRSSTVATNPPEAGSCVVIDTEKS